MWIVHTKKTIILFKTRSTSKFIPVPLPVRIKTHPMLPGQVENTMWGQGISPNFLMLLKFWLYQACVHLIFHLEINWTKAHWDLHKIWNAWDQISFILYPLNLMFYRRQEVMETVEKNIHYRHPKQCVLTHLNETIQRQKLLNLGLFIKLSLYICHYICNIFCLFNFFSRITKTYILIQGNNSIHYMDKRPKFITSARDYLQQTQCTILTYSWTFKLSNYLHQEVC